MGRFTQINGGNFGGGLIFNQTRWSDSVIRLKLLDWLIGTYRSIAAQLYVVNPTLGCTSNESTLLHVQEDFFTYILLWNSCHCLPTYTAISVLFQILGVVEKAGQPLLSQVKVVWQEQDTDFSKPVQAPACVPSLYNGNRVVVYGFTPNNCFMVSGYCC